MSEKNNIIVDSPEAVKNVVMSDPQLSSLVETMTSESITQLSMEFWEYVWLGITLGQAYQAS